MCERQVLYGQEVWGDLRNRVGSFFKSTYRAVIGLARYKNIDTLVVPAKESR